jgi:hypothetical protein
MTSTVAVAAHHGEQLIPQRVRDRPRDLLGHSLPKPRPAHDSHFSGGGFAVFGFGAASSASAEERSVGVDEFVVEEMAPSVIGTV